MEGATTAIDAHETLRKTNVTVSLGLTKYHNTIEAPSLYRKMKERKNKIPELE